MARSIEPIVVEVVRGEVVEARHVAHAVAVRDGEVIAAAGSAALLSYLRSAAKPIQALPLVRERPDLDDAEIAIVCASHLARADQLAAVRSVLARAPAVEDELECGPEPTPIEHNCSGKHAGMLALCRARGWPSDGYRRSAHRCQLAMLSEVAAAAEVEPASLPIAVDGCGVPTFALTLERMAHAFAGLPAREGGARVVRAMRAYPDLIRGPGAADTELMRSLPGWFAKGGAEAVFCAASEDGLGLALKVEDGGVRAVRTALVVFLRTLGVDLGALAVVPVPNSRGETVGEIRPAG